VSDPIWPVRASQPSMTQLTLMYCIADLQLVLQFRKVATLSCWSESLVAIQDSKTSIGQPRQKALEADRHMQVS